MKKNSKRVLFNPAVNRVLVATKEISQKEWNKHLPNPLTIGEKCVTIKEQDPEQLAKGYIAVKRKGVETVFGLQHFEDLKGRAFKWN